MNQRSYRVRRWILLGLMGWFMVGSGWDLTSVGAVEPVATNAAPVQFLLTPSSSRAEIAARLKELRTQENGLYREARALDRDLQRIDEEIQGYLAATNAIDDPDILAFKAQLDELDAKRRAVSSALAAKLRENPRFQGPLEMKRAARFRLDQIDKKIAATRDEQKMLQDRLATMR